MNFDASFTIIVILFSGLLGIILGSFYNVIIYRVNTGMGYSGRSQCLTCSHQLQWFELIPVLSFMIQRARCRSCRTTIDWQYPLIEIISGLLYAGLAWALLMRTTSWQTFGVSWVIWGIMIGIGIIASVYDYKHTVVLDRVFYALSAWMIMTFLFIHSPSLGDLVSGITSPSPIGSVLGLLLVPLPFFAIWWVSQGRLIGFGDIVIMGIFATIFGIVGGFSFVIFAFWIGAIWILLYMIVHTGSAYIRKEKQKSLAGYEIPFLPFLFLGAYIVGIIGIDILDIIHRLSGWYVL